MLLDAHLHHLVDHRHLEMEPGRVVAWYLPNRSTTACSCGSTVYDESKIEPEQDQGADGPGDERDAPLPGLARPPGAGPGVRIPRRIPCVRFSCRVIYGDIGRRWQFSALFIIASDGPTHMSVRRRGENLGSDPPSLLTPAGSRGKERPWVSGKPSADCGCDGEWLGCDAIRFPLPFCRLAILSSRVSIHEPTSHLVLRDACRVLLGFCLGAMALAGAQEPCKADPPRCRTGGPR